MATDSRALRSSCARRTAVISAVMGAAFLFACSGGSSGTASPGAPSVCQKSDRIGTYLLTLTEQAGGTCGPVAPSLVSLNPQMGDGGGASNCTIHSDVWSDGDCKNEHTYTCVTRATDATQPSGVGTVTADAVTVQETANGSTIDGTITVALDDPSGGCRSTYAVSYVRQ
ncbi:MAG: hypothetical protein JWO86_572 [Myxococcaceae bacterium]|nr:hypothetical protein [Myxococcaceae bacterium]